MEWYKNDKLHRTGDKPARIRPNGYMSWYKNNKRHRDGDKPAKIWLNGSIRIINATVTVISSNV